MNVCKIEGCTRPMRWTRGKYAGLCEVHMQEKAHAHSDEQSPASANGASGLGEPALVVMAREVARLRDDLRAAEEALLTEVGA